MNANEIDFHSMGIGLLADVVALVGAVTIAIVFFGERRD
jgi:hypothetical protein